MLSRASAVKREITVGFSVRMNISEKDILTPMSFQHLTKREPMCFCFNYGRATLVMICFVAPEPALSFKQLRLAKSGQAVGCFGSSAGSPGPFSMPAGRIRFLSFKLIFYKQIDPMHPTVISFIILSERLASAYRKG